MHTKVHSLIDITPLTLPNFTSDPLIIPLEISGIIKKNALSSYVKVIFLSSPSKKCNAYISLFWYLEVYAETLW